jgi:hypothetical protein
MMPKDRRNLRSSFREGTPDQAAVVSLAVTDMNREDPMAF